MVSRSIYFQQPSSRTGALLIGSDARLLLATTRLLCLISRFDNRSVCSAPLGRTVFERPGNLAWCLSSFGWDQACRRASEEDNDFIVVQVIAGIRGDRLDRRPWTCRALCGSGDGQSRWKVGPPMAMVDNDVGRLGHCPWQS
ncbi:hypothetical protein RRG08_038699 [Elysia crispata]|uniref:Uncharacterized protein n=1 Tax=Elysia crispata TaxID=231223 RepID=A0AAE1DI03_9GAST|nr:hypothetical protein RRG08_038699 [Elysia crispata]